VRVRGTDYFENSRRATYVQQAYAIRNPRGSTLYGKRYGLNERPVLLMIENFRSGLIRRITRSARTSRPGSAGPVSAERYPRRAFNRGRRDDVPRRPRQH